VTTLNRGHTDVDQDCPFQVDEAAQITVGGAEDMYLWTFPPGTEAAEQTAAAFEASHRKGAASQALWVHATRSMHARLERWHAMQHCMLVARACCAEEEEDDEREKRYLDDRDAKRQKVEHAPEEPAPTAPTASEPAPNAPKPAQAPTAAAEPAQAPTAAAEWAEDPTPSVPLPDELRSPPPAFSLMANRGLPDHFNRRAAHSPTLSCKRGRHTMRCLYHACRICLGCRLASQDADGRDALARLPALSCGVQKP
jgi:hypothetical protein